MTRLLLLLAAVGMLGCVDAMKEPDYAGAAKESWLLGLTGSEIVRRASRPPDEVFNFKNSTVFRWGENRYICAYIGTNDRCFMVRWDYVRGEEGKITRMEFQDGWVEKVKTEDPAQ